MQMKTLEMLETLAIYYDGNRQVGHTRTMLNGAKNVDCLVLFPTHSIAQTWRKEIPAARVVTLGNLQSLRGPNKPLAVDNSSMYVILSASISEIKKLKAELARAKKDRAMLEAGIKGLMSPQKMPKHHMPQLSK